MMLCLAAALLGCACSASRSEQYQLEGDAYFDLGRTLSALESYREALALNNENALAHYGLGRCLLLQHRPEDALNSFREAILFAPDLEAAYWEAIPLLLSKNQHDEALQLAQMLENTRPEEGGWLHAQVLAQCGRSDEALARLRDLRNRYPDSVAIRIAMAKLLMALHQPEEAESELRQVLASADTDVFEARMALVDACRLQNKTSSLVEEYQALYEANPVDSGIGLAWARILLYEGQTNAADAIAQEILKNDPKAGWANYVAGNCSVARGEYAEAMPYLHAARAALPQEPLVAQAFAAAHERLARDPATTATEDPGPESVASDWRSLWRQGRLITLLEQRDELLPHDPSPSLRESLMLAALLTHNNTLAEALAAELPGDSPFGAYWQALKQKDWPQLIEVLSQWTEQEPERLLLRENAHGYALAQSGARAQAISVFLHCLEQWPGHGLSLYAVAEVFRGAGIPEFAARALQTLTGRYPENSDAHLMLYRTLCEASLPGEARTAAETAYARFPHLHETLLNLAEAYLAAKELELARDALRDSGDAVQQDDRLKLALASILIRLGECEDARALLGPSTGTSAFNRQARILDAFCSAFSGDWEAVQRLATLEDPGARDQSGGFLRASALLHVGREQEAIAVLSGIHAASPREAQARNIMLFALGQTGVELSREEAVLANTLGKIQEALAAYAFGAACQSAFFYGAAAEAFAEADTLIDECPLLTGHYFYALLRRESRAGLEEAAQSFVQRHPGLPEVWLGLANVMAVLENPSAEQEAVEKAVETGPGLVEVWQYRGRLKEQAGDFTGAVEDYQRVLEIDPDDPMANNNLAYCLLMSGGDANQALDAAQRAAQQWPDNPHVAHTLGLAQQYTGALEASRQNLWRALGLRPGDPAFLLDYGKVLLALDRREEGLGHIRLALRYADAFGLAFPRREEAERLMSEHEQS